MNTYTNPIIPGFNPDPSIVRLHDDFFLVTSSFEYVPGVPIYHSTDLIQWTLIGHALTRPSQLQIQSPEPGGGVWATTIRFHEGTFYVFAANYTRYRPQEDDRVWPRAFYVCTQDIWDSASWSDPIYFDQVGFDQDIFWDDDGTVYLSSTYRKIDCEPTSTLNDFAVHICTIDLKTGDSTSEPQLIRESLTGIAEGSHLFKRGGYYFLFTAEGGTGSQHSEWVFRSETSPFGPWEPGPHNPLWYNGPHDEVQNTGHADLVEDARGRWWAVLLGVRPTYENGRWEASVLGRETFLVSVDWIDNWPIFNGGKKISLQAKGPGLYQHQIPATWKDDFSASQLQLGWYRKNTPTKLDYSLTARPNCLRLFGGPYNLSVPACPTLFLRKQTHRFCTWETRLSFQPSSVLEEAGAVVWWNYFTYCSIGIRKNNTTRVISLRDAAGKASEWVLRREESEVVLRVVCGDVYKFGFCEVDKHEESEEFTWVGEVSNFLMTREPPVGLAFTGMMLGVYSFAERQGSLTPADFLYVEVK